MIDSSKTDWYSIINSNCSNKNNYSTNHRDIVNRLFLSDKSIKNSLLRNGLRTIKLERTKKSEIDFY